jgi:hypothetical protein
VSQQEEEEEGRNGSLASTEIDEFAEKFEDEFSQVASFKQQQIS